MHTQMHTQSDTKSTDFLSDNWANNSSQGVIFLSQIAGSSIKKVSCFFFQLWFWVTKLADVFLGIKDLESGVENTAVQTRKE